MIGGVNHWDQLTNMSKMMKWYYKQKELNTQINIQHRVEG